MVSFYRLTGGAGFTGQRFTFAITISFLSAGVISFHDNTTRSPSRSTVLNQPIVGGITGGTHGGEMFIVVSAAAFVSSNQ
jgi:hypothetical protein